MKSPKLHAPSPSQGQSSEEDNLPPRQPSKFQKTARFVVSVDQQIKSSFDAVDEAETEAARIRALFPKLTVAVRDSLANSVDELGAMRSEEA